MRRRLPGEPVRYAFCGEVWDPSFLRRWWFLIRRGARVVAATEREFVVMRSGGASANRRRPRVVIYRVPLTRMRMSKVHGGAVLDLGREQIWVAPQVGRFVTEAQSWAAGEVPDAPHLEVPAPTENASRGQTELWVLRGLALVGWLTAFVVSRMSGLRPADLFGAAGLHHGSRVLYELIGLGVVGLFVIVVLALGWMFFAVRHSRLRSRARGG